VTFVFKNKIKFPKTPSFSSKLKSKLKLNKYINLNQSNE